MNILLDQFNKVIFNVSGTHTWTCPTGVTEVMVTCVGGGAGKINLYQDDTTPSGNYCNGGSGAAIWRTLIGVTPNTNYTIVVGTGSNTINDSANFLYPAENPPNPISRTNNVTVTLPSGTASEFKDGGTSLVKAEGASMLQFNANYIVDGTWNAGEPGYYSYAYTRNILSGTPADQIGDGGTPTTYGTGGMLATGVRGNSVSDGNLPPNFDKGGLSTSGFKGVNGYTGAVVIEW